MGIPIWKQGNGLNVLFNLLFNLFNVKLYNAKSALNFMEINNSF